MEQQRITIWLDGDTWMATFHNDQDMLRAFGTDSIPTPFLSLCTSGDVAARLRERNPDAIIKWSPNRPKS